MPAKSIYLNFHGNGGNLSYHSKGFEQLSQEGAGALPCSWRPKFRWRQLFLISGTARSRTLAASKIPWLPVRLLIRDEFRADPVAGKVRVPVFQVHCTDNPIVPLAFGREPHQLFQKRRDLIEVPGRCHPVSPSGFDEVLMKRMCFNPGSVRLAEDFLGCERRLEEALEAACPEIVSWKAFWVKHGCFTEARQVAGPSTGEIAD